MPIDATTLGDQLTAIQTAITTALTSPRPNWKVGQVSMNQADYLKMLLDQQKELIIQIKEIPVESVDTHQHRINALGQDMTEYHDEPDI